MIYIEYDGYEGGFVGVFSTIEKAKEFTALPENRTGGFTVYLCELDDPKVHLPIYQVGYGDIWTPFETVQKRQQEEAERAIAALPTITVPELAKMLGWEERRVRLQLGLSV